MIKLKTAPADYPMELDEVKTHLRITGTDEDDYIQSLIIAATSYCEVFQNRAYVTQTWEYWCDSFPDYFELPRPPLASVTSIDYYNTSDVKATVAAADYFVDTKSEPGRVHLNYNKSWPSTTLRPINGICVTYIAGYGYSENIPQNIKQAILLLCGHWFENREGSIDKPLSKIPFAVEALLWQERVF